MIGVASQIASTIILTLIFDLSELGEYYLSIMIGGLLGSYADGGYAAYSFQHLTRSLPLRSVTERSLSVVALTVIPLCLAGVTLSLLLNISTSWVLCSFFSVILDKQNQTNRNILIYKNALPKSFMIDSAQSTIFLILLVVSIFIPQLKGRTNLDAIIFIYVSSFVLANVLGSIISGTGKAWVNAARNVFHRIATFRCHPQKLIRMLRRTLLISVELNMMSLWWGMTLVLADQVGGREAAGLFGVLQRFLGLSRTVTAFTLAVRRREHYLSKAHETMAIRTLTEALGLALVVSVASWCWLIFCTSSYMPFAQPLTGFLAVTEAISHYYLELGAVVGMEYAYYHFSQMTMGRNQLFRRTLPPVLASITFGLCALWLSVSGIVIGEDQILQLYAATLAAGLVYLWPSSGGRPAASRPARR